MDFLICHIRSDRNESGLVAIHGSGCNSPSHPSQRILPAPDHSNVTARRRTCNRLSDACLAALQQESWHAPLIAKQLWIRELACRLPFGKALVAIANKPARQIWAMVTTMPGLIAESVRHEQDSLWEFSQI